MRHIYLSFLGLGSFNKETKQYSYDKAVYEIDGRQSKKTEFVQVAELELLGADSFDKCLIVGTETSLNHHFSRLEEQLRKTGVPADGLQTITIKEDMSPECQWEWFEKVLEQVDLHDTLTIDLTHGYRSVPIVISAAINFLQKARHIQLNAVYYGAFEKNRECAPIVDLKEFYLINEWADGVSRLTEDADARKLASVAEQTADFQMGELNDPAIIQAFEDLTNTIRNIDIQNISAKTNTAIRLIREKEQSASVTGKILLKLVMDKFISLTTSDTPPEKYNHDYFILQLRIIRLLLDHQLYMQAYTVMREFIGSIGLIQVEKANIGGMSQRRDQRSKAEIFIRMITNPEEKWKFEGNAKKMQDNLLDYYRLLESAGIVTDLRKFCSQLTDYRNGFDHAWLGKSGAEEDIREKGNAFHLRLENVIEQIQKHELFIY